MSPGVQYIEIPCIRTHIHALCPLNPLFIQYVECATIVLDSDFLFISACMLRMHQCISCWNIFETITSIWCMINKA